MLPATSPNPYTPADARRLMAALLLTLEPRQTVAAGPQKTDPVEPVARYCCAAASLEDLLARAAADDPRCPCARAHGWNREATR